MGFPMEERARKHMNVMVQYDAPRDRARRESRMFPNMQAAKRFYEKCFKDGLNPKVIKAQP